MSTGNTPAFPCGDTVTGAEPFSIGLTKREYFAALAMQGWIASRSLRDNGFNQIERTHISDGAVKMADAMIKALEAK